ncbi:hypothetical protein CC86DRAFT_290670 [Ophiobolus disseminans]|uniref:MARVEL domain-containing protein n=1 Tax=Ophiobolus disseminans TaxID=1469910 RepID=A0A6A7A4Q4_9PLEO|nr:hypothetical protein CC86DRAFT_290670 [Ophiobolus disseminans]
MPPPAFSDQTPPMKPLHLLSHEQNPSYHHAPTYEDFEHVKAASHEDAALKARIRRLRIFSRVLAFLISIGVLIPISMTLAKYLSTRNTFRTFTSVSGQPITRTAWAKDTRAWPTWMYFAVAAVSVVLNFSTVFSYKFGVQRANLASYVTSSFSWVVMLGNLVVWSVAAGMYRGEKDKGGKSDDLWGWTCSAAARAIQKEFAEEVDFDRFCNVQSISWYIGLVQAGSAALTVVIYIMVLRRKKSKKNLEQHLRIRGLEPVRR